MSGQERCTFLRRCDTCESERIWLIGALQTLFSAPVDRGRLMEKCRWNPLRRKKTKVELRQAIVAMMNRKDELEEQNAYVKHTHTDTERLNKTMLDMREGEREILDDLWLYTCRPLLWTQTRGCFVLTWGEERAAVLRWNF
ncbi:hypothetical protein WMY93_009971 [Mugilogobius chulae]|uniref:Uncharacterized protein n=1 Tax=Mugilogobius chulae TaxID=88201 RepID=A0AAW0P9R1_9GOBI